MANVQLKHCCASYLDKNIELNTAKEKDLKVKNSSMKNIRNKFGLEMNVEANNKSKLAKYFYYIKIKTILRHYNKKWRIFFIY
jgi:hypothetical protein